MNYFSGISGLIIAVFALWGCGGGVPRPEFQEGTILTGEVVLEGQKKSVERALIQVEQDGQIIRETFSDRNGRFSLEDLPEGKFDLLVTKGDQYVPYRYSANQDDLLDVALFRGGRQFLQVLMDARQTTLKGRIISAEGKEPVVGAIINTYPTTLTASSGEEGFFLLESNRFEAGVPYKIIVSHGEYQPEQLDIEEIEIAQVNELSVIQLRPRLLDEGVRQGEVDYGSEDSKGDLTQGEK